MTRNRHSTANGFIRHFNFLPCMMKSDTLIKRVSGLVAIFTLFLISGCQGPQSTLDPAGPAARSISHLWWGMFIYFTLVFIAVCGLWFYAIRPKEEEASPDKVKRIAPYFIIGGGIFLPGISIFVLLLFGIPIGHSLLPHPDEKVMRIEVIGHQWYWTFRYPESGVSLINELHLPKGQAVDMYVTSKDVIHSFWVPRLNGKIDAIPGHTNILRLKATKAGEIRGQCAEFCGEWHARMIFKVQVHTPEAFKVWQQNQSLKHHSKRAVQNG